MSQPEQRLVAALHERGQTIATAESLTAGMVCARLTEVPGSSAVVRGGLIVYATELKIALAGVDAELLAEHGAVHPEVARQLAGGARTRCGADWGVGLTGVAGPASQDGVPPGTVHVAVSGPLGPAGVVHRVLRFDGDRARIRACSVDAALALLGEHLGASPRSP